ncbi:MAG: 5-formyltetrahydrofolate cyclo-ligase [Magnetospirillum sp.]|nr:MAG: 5-formyltetrahydrofolate cyclo-ligase [Magnetospirillum sp.]
MTDSVDTPSDKTELRRRASLARAAAAVLSADAAAAALAAQAPALSLSFGTVVAGYWPMGDEIDPRPLMLALAEWGCRLALPVVVGRLSPLVFRVWRPGDELEAGGHGTRHPPASAASVRPSVVLTPLLAFDRHGFRLGYGGGYYDLTLARLREDGRVVVIGLGFAAQEVPSLPVEPWDQPLDMILTESGVIAVENA